MQLLFLSYNGTTDPLLHTQGLAYLAGLRERGVTVHLLTFERCVTGRAAEQRRRTEVRRRLLALGIQWHPLRYHKYPLLLSTVCDLACGIAAAWRLVARYRIGLLHARGTIPAAIAWPVARLTGRRWLLDVRGLVSEEYVDGGIWTRGSVAHRLIGAVERRLIRGADAIVVLTQAAGRILGDRARWGIPPRITIQVIPCCASTERFAAPQGRVRPDVAAALAGRCVLAYVGSVGTWYLLEEMVAFFRALKARRADAHLLIVSPREHHERIRQATSASPGLAGAVTVAAAEPEEVPAYLACARAGLAFIRPVFSKQFSSPTKIGEYLASGLPVVANRGVGDLDELLGPDRVGVVARDLTPEAYTEAAEALLTLLNDPGLAERCRDVARREFSLALGQAKYWESYQAALGRPGSPGASGSSDACTVSESCAG